MSNYKKLILALVLNVAFFGMAAAQEASVPKTGILSNYFSWIMAIGAAIVLIIALVLIARLNTLLSQQLMSTKYEEFKAINDSSIVAPSETSVDFWGNLKKKLWEDAAPVEREAEIMLSHNYDGIRELDNKLPPWWVNMFILTVLFSGVYMYHYHWGGDGKNQLAEYEQKAKVVKRERFMALQKQANSVDESSVKSLKDENALASGELIYKANCASCHGQKGEGGVGPNMTDAYWLHGGDIKSIFHTVKYGVPEKGMIAWDAQLGPYDIQKVSSYIMEKIVGTNVANGKAPQGVLFNPNEIQQQEEVVVDSLKKS
jgi:cytochrome c oxidase cbb3-type subunit III